MLALGLFSLTTTQHPDRQQHNGIAMNPSNPNFRQSGYQNYHSSGAPQPLQPLTDNTGYPIIQNGDLPYILPSASHQQVQHDEQYLASPPSSTSSLAPSSTSYLPPTHPPSFNHNSSQFRTAFPTMQPPLLPQHSYQPPLQSSFNQGYPEQRTVSLTPLPPPNATTAPQIEIPANQGSTSRRPSSSSAKRPRTVADQDQDQDEGDDAPGPKHTRACAACRRSKQGCTYSEGRTECDRCIMRKEFCYKPLMAIKRQPPYVLLYIIRVEVAQPFPLDHDQNLSSNSTIKTPSFPSSSNSSTNLPPFFKIFLLALDLHNLLNLLPAHARATTRSTNS